MYNLHCTQKLLARIKKPIADPIPAPTTALGNWYATALLWKPQVALFVNEATRLPVLMPLAPAATVAARFPLHLAQVLTALGVEPAFIDREMAAMAQVSIAKTASRSILGTMNDFSWMAEVHNRASESTDLTGLSVFLAATPIGPMKYKSPADMLDELVENWPA